MFSVAGMDDGCGWPECFFTKHRHVRGNIGDDSWLIESAFALDWLATKQDTPAHLNRCLDLAIQFGAEIAASYWSDLRLIVQRIANPQFGGFFHEFMLKFRRRTCGKAARMPCACST